MNSQRHPARFDLEGKRKRKEKIEQKGGRGRRERKERERKERQGREEDEGGEGGVRRRGGRRGLGKEGIFQLSKLLSESVVLMMNVAHVNSEYSCHLQW